MTNISDNEFQSAIEETRRIRIADAESNFTTLRQIVNQLKSCHYVCEAGPLENNQAFMALEKMADQEIVSTE